MAEKEYIERDAVLDLLTNRDVVINANDEVAFIREDVECLPDADVVPRKAYTELQAENCKLKNQVWHLKKKIREMKSDASWDEDIRRGQVQGMW